MYNSNADIGMDPGTHFNCFHQFQTVRQILFQEAFSQCRRGNLGEVADTSTLRGYTVKHPGKRGDYKAPVVHASHASKNICVNHDSMTMNLRGEAFKANPNLGENDTEMTRFWRWFWARHLLNGAPNRHPFPDTHQKGCLMDTRSPTHLQGVEKTDTWMTRIDTHERMHISLFVYP